MRKPFGKKKIYFVLINIVDSDHMPLIQRIREAIPLIQKNLVSLTDDDFHLVFKSQHGEFCAFFANSAHDASYIRAAIEGKIDGTTDTSPLWKHDSCMVLEIGEGWTSIGFSRAWTWLQRRRAKQEAIS